MIQHFKGPSAMRPGSAMPPIELSEEQLSSLAAFLLKLTPGNAGALATSAFAATHFSAAAAALTDEDVVRMVHELR